MLNIRSMHKPLEGANFLKEAKGVIQIVVTRANARAKSHVATPAASTQTRTAPDARVGSGAVP